MTRTELLDLWFQRVPQWAQRATIIDLYQAAPGGVKDAMVTAMKEDLVAVLQAQADQAEQTNAELDSEVADVTGTP